MILLAEKLQKGIYHIGGTHDVSYYEIANKIAESLKLDKNYILKGYTKDIGIPKNEAPENTTLDTKSTYEYRSSKYMEYNFEFIHFKLK